MNITKEQQNIKKLTFFVNHIIIIVIIKCYIRYYNFKIIYHSRLQKHFSAENTTRHPRHYIIRRLATTTVPHNRTPTLGPPLVDNGINVSTSYHITESWLRLRSDGRADNNSSIPVAQTEHGS